MSIVVLKFLHFSQLDLGTKVNSARTTTCASWMNAYLSLAQYRSDLRKRYAAFHANYLQTNQKARDRLDVVEFGPVLQLAS